MLVLALEENVLEELEGNRKRGRSIEVRPRRSRLNRRRKETGSWEAYRAEGRKWAKTRIKKAREDWLHGRAMLRLKSPFLTMGVRNLGRLLWRSGDTDGNRLKQVVGCS